MSNAFSTSMLPPEVQGLLKMVEDRLATYVEAMAPGKPIKSTDGAQHQKVLWTGVINFLLQQNAQVFIHGWAIFLQTVLTHRQGCFSPMYVNRFREELKLTLEDRRNFERMIHLAYTTCDPKSRALSMKQIDMAQILSMLPREDMRQKVLSFYTL